METTINLANYTDLRNKYELYLTDKGLSNTISNFEAFLNDNKISTTHATEVYNLVYGIKSTASKKFSTDELHVRNAHPKLKSTAKWVGPVAVATIAVGVTGILTFAALTAVAGTQILGLTMQANAAANAAKVATVGFGVVGLPVGLASTSIAKLLTAHDLNKKYGNHKKAIEKGELDSIEIDLLLNDIAKEKEEILNLKQGKNNIFSKIFRGIKRTIKNVDNRIKTHKLEHIHNEIAEKLISIVNNKDLNKTDKELAAKPYLDILEKINTFTYEEFKKSRVFTLLTCNDGDAKHTHKTTLENEDIFAEMQRRADQLTKILEANGITAPKPTLNHTESEKVAVNYLNLEDSTTVDKGTCNLIKKCKDRLAATSIRPIKPATSISITSHTVSGNILNVVYSDGKSVNFNLTRTDISNVTLNKSGTYINITYADGSTQRFPKNGVKIPSLQVAGAIQILTNLKDATFRNEIIARGNKSADIDKYETDLTNLIYTSTTKKVKAHARVFNKAEYNANPSYIKITEDCDDLIRTLSHKVTP